MPGNLDDTRAQCPGFESMEPTTAGASEPVTVLSYQLYKFRLYQATSSLTREIYGQRKLQKNELISHIQRIDQQLVEIWDSIPPELRLRSFSEDESCMGSEGSVERVFRLQALALQLLYDNLQLILHRPLLQYEVTTQDRRARPQRSAVEGNGSPESEEPDTTQQARTKNGVITVSRNRMWESGMRTSWLSEQPYTLRLASNTHAAAYMAIQTFSAGVTLGLFAMSSPFSRQSQIAKQAIGRLIRAPRSLG